MADTVDRAMGRAIAAMYKRIGEEVTVDDLARTAMYSKFHFSRVFRQVTGVSPGRFLSALRFQEAKRLLAATRLSVAEISNRVGYSSLGTFSTRFKKFVGVTPTEYRRGAPAAAELPGSGCARRPPSGPPLATVSAVLRGRVNALLRGRCGQAFVGVFPDPVPHGSPVSATVLPQPGGFVLSGVPAGTWYVLAHGVWEDSEAVGVAAPDGPLGLVGRLGPIVVAAGASIPLPAVDLRPMRPVDLPVLPAPFATRPAVTGPARAGGPAGLPRQRVVASAGSFRSGVARPLTGVRI